MKWGKRGSKSSSPTYKSSVKTFGGDKPHKNLEATPKSVDAQKARGYKERAKNGNTDALSTKELQTLVNRMNLEQQYSRMNPPKISAGRQIVSALLPAIGTSAYSQYQAYQPQQAPIATTPASSALAIPSRKRLAGDILKAVGKQVVSEQSANIGKIVISNLLK